MLRLPASEKSLWREAYVGAPIYPALTEDIAVDVAIIGAGITGLTAAYLLKQSGFSVAVFDKGTVGAGTTGRTTGKLTSQHSLVYSDLKNRLSVNAARAYGQVNQAAIEQVRNIIKKENIDCDFKHDDNYVFTSKSNQIATFKQEAKTAIEIGLPATFETSTPLPFKISAAVKFANQSKLNSMKYLLGLAKAVQGRGSYVFENSKVIRIKDGAPGYITANKYKVIAKNIIVATNVPTLPLAARGAYCIYEYPTESYIVAGRLKKDLRGMYISPDKQHYSILPVTLAGQQMMLIGGESNISGLRAGKTAKYQKLAGYAKEHFGIVEFTHKWSDRDYMAYDGLPLIGKLYPWSKHLYVASAFRKWGLSGGSAAAMILRDIIAGDNNPNAHHFEPNRLKAAASFPRVAAKHLKPFS